VGFSLLTLINARLQTAVGVGINLVLGTLAAYGVFRVLWWILGKVKPIKAGHSTVLRFLLVLLWPVVLIVFIQVAVIVIGGVIMALGVGK